MFCESTLWPPSSSRRHMVSLVCRSRSCTDYIKYKEEEFYLYVSRLNFLLCNLLRKNKMTFPLWLFLHILSRLARQVSHTSILMGAPTSLFRSFYHQKSPALLPGSVRAQWTAGKFLKQNCLGIYCVSLLRFHIKAWEKGEMGVVSVYYLAI